MTSTRISRHIASPRAAVYRALIDPVAVARWKVPQGMTSYVHVFEAWQGGAFRISLTYDEAGGGVGKTTARQDHYHGRVAEVVAFEPGDPALCGEMTITIRLADAEGGGTELDACHEGLPPGLSPADN